MFVDTQSIRQLKAAKSRTHAPPSNQQQEARNPKVSLPSRTFPARVEPFSSNREMLQEETPASAYGAKLHKFGAKRAYAMVVESDDEEADPFETDDRPVDNSKRVAIQSALPPRKRPQSSALEPQSPASQTAIAYSPHARGAQSSHAPAAQFSSQYTLVNPSAAHGAPSSSALTGRISSQADLGALKLATAEASALSRIQQREYRGGPQSRMRWSEYDSKLLIELICETNASWAIIERRHNDKFDHPRNQQAYRDKARNLKVDFLKADAVLPPGFNHVVLGPKEIAIVRGRGKNHLRMEHDLDSRGNPVNTAATALR